MLLVNNYEYIFEQINDLMQFERDNLSEMNGYMVVSVAEFLIMLVMRI